MGSSFPSFARLAISLTLLSGVLWNAVPIPAQAQYAPPDRGLPGRREGGGTRGNGCTMSDRRLTSLTPQFTVDETLSVYGLTVSSTPTFYWYVPEVGAEALEFILMDEDGNEIYLEEMPVNTASGIVSVEVPPAEGSNGSRLDPNKDYHWFFSIICDASDRSGDIITEGWIRRVPLTASLDEQLKTVPPLEQSDVFMQAGIWHDAISATAEQRCLQPGSSLLSSQWNELLTSVGLEGLSNEPLLLSCPAN